MMRENRSMPRRISTTMLTTLCLCLVLLACGSEDIDEPGAGTDDGTPTAAAASPTSEPPATPSSPPPSTSIADLTTLDWQLAEIDGAPILDGSIVTLTFIADNRSVINGYTDCHSYFAGIEWDESSFQISESGPFAGLDQTERPCQHPLDGPRQDRYFFEALADVTRYQASNEQLVLLDDSGEPQLTFAPRPPVTVDPALAGTSWRLTGPYLLPDTTITLTFDDASVNGNDGCNDYGAQLLAASDGRLLFGNGSETDMACLTPEGVMEQADRYAQTLSYIAGYRIDGDQLQLVDQPGSVQLLYMREGSDAFDSALAAQRWGLIEANGQPAVPESLVTFEFSEGYINGTNSCNGITGAMPLANDGAIKIDFAGFARDAQGCRSDEITDQAQLVEAILEDATSYALTGDRLTITDAAGTTVVFGPAADILLIGRTWNVSMLYTELPDGGIMGKALVEGTEITLTFNEDGTLGGSSGCNTYGGNYTLDGAAITIDSLVWTLMACLDPPGVMEQETTYLDTLGAVTTWEIGPNGLTLTTDDGRALRELNTLEQ